MSAVAFIPVAVLTGTLVADETLRTAVVTVGVLAGLVQALGLLRWVFLVPHLARESAPAPTRRPSTWCSSRSTATSASRSASTSGTSSPAR